VLDGSSASLEQAHETATDDATAEETDANAGGHEANQPTGRLGACQT
jgi:hypothetical protein